MLIEPVPCSKKGCRHYRGIIQPDGTEATERHVCAAFPAGVPVEIVRGENMHTAPYPGDRGVRYEAGEPEEWVEDGEDEEGAEDDE